MKSPNHRHHHGCSECSENRRERLELAKVGIGWGSCQALQLHRKQLLRVGGMGWKEIERVMKIIHPPLMANLKLNAAGRIGPVDRRLYWERRLGWDKKGAVLRRERERQDQRDRAYAAMLRNSRRQKRERERLLQRRRVQRAARTMLRQLRKRAAAPVREESLMSRRRGRV